MRVELENIRLAKSPLSDTIYAGVLEKDGKKWRDKVDITGDFITAVLARWNGFKEVIRDPDGKKYEISVKEIK